MLQRIQLSTHSSGFLETSRAVVENVIRRCEPNRRSLYIRLRIFPVQACSGEVLFELVYWR